MSENALGRHLLLRFKERSALLKDDSATRELLTMGFSVRKKVVKIPMSKYVPAGTTERDLSEALKYLKEQGLAISIKDNIIFVTTKE